MSSPIVKTALGLMVGASWHAPGNKKKPRPIPKTGPFGVPDRRTGNPVPHKYQPPPKMKA